MRMVSVTKRNVNSYVIGTKYLLETMDLREVKGGNSIRFSLPESTECLLILCFVSEFNQTFLE